MIWTTSIDLHFLDPSAKFTLLFQSSSLDDKGRSIPSFREFKLPMQEWWTEKNKKQVSVPEVVWELWGEVTQWLEDKKEINRVQCVQVRAEPSPGYVVIFEPSEDFYEEYSND